MSSSRLFRLVSDVQHSDVGRCFKVQPAAVIGLLVLDFRHAKRPVERYRVRLGVQPDTAPASDLLRCSHRREHERLPDASYESLPQWWPLMRGGDADVLDINDVRSQGETTSAGREPEREQPVQRTSPPEGQREPACVRSGSGNVFLPWPLTVRAISVGEDRLPVTRPEFGIVGGAPRHGHQGRGAGSTEAPGNQRGKARFAFLPHSRLSRTPAWDLLSRNTALTPASRLRQPPSDRPVCRRAVSKPTGAPAERSSSTARSTSPVPTY